ncbi:protein-disulfide reductase DsbD domain-containing protein [Solitalea koreensis]|uniref:Disulphide bond corrector protein DsbC n=1 Tax=Solitalea koreensis TaxID=543615 RepID=A0A521DP37_9SPHI|nr:protein-disulfide reductase DsbD domain-containing protein [Solitalea koreensis]SMO73362.1 Disulphide bond corrector protein DsbC [Solitalea koreensis]
MKKLALITTIVFLSFVAKSQILQPVKWSYSAKKTGKSEAIVYVKATIEKGWHLYSQNLKSDDGPIKTTFTFPPSKDYSLVGKTLEPQAINRYEETFKMNVAFFENSVVFQQKVKLNSNTAVVKGKVEFMTCNDKQCLPPDEIEFSVPVK